MGSAIGGLEQIEEAHTILKERGPSRISPFTVPMMIADMGAGMISIALGARGPNYCTVSACSSGAHAIGEAFETIRRGDATAMIAGGSEACVTPLALAAFCASRAVSVCPRASHSSIGLICLHNSPFLVKATTQYRSPSHSRMRTPATAGAITSAGHTERRS